MTLFWPFPRDLRQAGILASNRPHCVLGAIDLLAGAMCAGMAVLGYAAARERPKPDMQSRRITFEQCQQWAELALVLVLAWFIKSQMASHYGDGPADEALAGWLSPGGIYFAIALLYVSLRLLSRRFAQQDSQATQEGPALPRSTSGRAGLFAHPQSLDWLATYLGLTVIASWFLSVGLDNRWHAPVFFGVIVTAFGIAYYQLGRRLKRSEAALVDNGVSRREDPNLERWGAYLGLVYGLGLSLRKALKGGANLYVGNEDAWDNLFWNWIPLAMLIALGMGMFFILARPKRSDDHGGAFPNAYAMIWLVLITQNVLAQVVTGPSLGPHGSWNEFAFNIFYLILFCLTGVIVFHYHVCYCRLRRQAGAGESGC